MYKAVGLFFSYQRQLFGLPMRLVLKPLPLTRHFTLFWRTSNQSLPYLYALVSEFFFSTWSIKVFVSQVIQNIEHSIVVNTFCWYTFAVGVRCGIVVVPTVFFQCPIIKQTRTHTKSTRHACDVVILQLFTRWFAVQRSDVVSQWPTWAALFLDHTRHCSVPFEAMFIIPAKTSHDFTLQPTNRAKTVSGHQITVICRAVNCFIFDARFHEHIRIS